MLRLLIYRILPVVPQVLVASFIIFLVMSAAPGDPAAIKLGPDATPEQLMRERERLGVDKSMLEQYWVWLQDAVHLNLGESFATSQPVSDMLARAFPRTLALASTALVIALLVGVTTGLFAGLRPGGWIDKTLAAANSLIMSVPAFFFGILLIIVFSVWFRLLPPSGAGHGLFDMRYLALPATAVGLVQMSIFSRFVRASVVTVLSDEFVRTARAKGLRRRTVVIDHVLRNALLPLVTVVGIQASRLLGGAVVVESVFAYPGMGRLAVEAISNRDYAVVQGVLLVVLLIFFVLNLIVDLSYSFLDPGLRHRGYGE